MRGQYVYPRKILVHQIDAGLTKPSRRTLQCRPGWESHIESWLNRPLVGLAHNSKTTLVPKSQDPTTDKSALIRQEDYIGQRRDIMMLQMRLVFLDTQRPVTTRSEPSPGS